MHGTPPRSGPIPASMTSVRIAEERQAAGPLFGGGPKAIPRMIAGKARAQTGALARPAPRSFSRPRRCAE